MTHEIMNNSISKDGGDIVFTPLLIGGGIHARKDKAIKITDFRANIMLTWFK